MNIVIEKILCWFRFHDWRKFVRYDKTSGYHLKGLKCNRCQYRVIESIR